MRNTLRAHQEREDHLIFPRLCSVYSMESPRSDSYIIDSLISDLVTSLPLGAAGDQHLYNT